MTPGQQYLSRWLNTIDYGLILNMIRKQILINFQGEGYIYILYIARKILGRLFLDAPWSPLSLEGSILVYFCAVLLDEYDHVYFYLNQK